MSVTSGESKTLGGGVSSGGDISSDSGVSSRIFREYDIRGVAGEELTPEVARLVARAFAEWLDETGGPREGAGPGGAGLEGPGPGGAGQEAAGRVAERAPRVAIVGRDNRLSSPGLAEGVARGLAEAGFEVIDLGIVPTPVFYWARVKHGLPPGVMVTGSHNEARYNGLKLAAGPATIYGEDIQEVGRRARLLAVPSRAARPPGAARPSAAGRAAAPATARRPGATRPERGDLERRSGGGAVARPLEVLEDYLADICERVATGGAAGRRLRVAVDCGNGTAALAAPELLRRLGYEVIPLFAELDGNFPGHWPDPVVPENLTHLREAVRREKADLGVAFDGDADRLGVVDDQGEILWGDMLMILFWREILARRPGVEALVEVKCSQGLVDEIRRLGGRPVFHRTGHSLIKATMRRTGAPFAGEMSGHMFFADEYYGFDDALYAAARLTRILAEAGKPLSELLADRPRYFATPEVRVECPDEAKAAVVEAVRRRFARQGLEVIDVDGARVIFPGGAWLLVRASNTQPALVVRCEARTAEELEQVKAQVAEVLRESQAEAGVPAGLTLPDW